MKHVKQAVPTLAIVVAMLCAPATYTRADTNIALNQSVSVFASDPDSNAGYNNNTSDNLQSIANGTILPGVNTVFLVGGDDQAVDWNGAGYVFKIDLGGLFTINSVLLDADDNDEYILQYLNPNTSQWDLLYDAPIVSQGAGFRTRPNASDPNQLYSLPPSVTTDAVRIYGGQSNDNETYDGHAGQGGYGVAQVELFGSAAVTSAPEPCSMALLGGGLLGLIGLRRRRVA